ncbi:hypothetical protein [Nonomuraea sp. JJY05]|jgi:hypothetical protein|uniref:hypothetical protein n=1 Tax=Nonomuraea sp. JJY05 TaxID=3350255 RepID=UPI00373EDB6D
MSLRWEIDNKVQALKRRARWRFRSQRHHAGKTDRAMDNPKQSGGKVKDTPKH